MKVPLLVAVQERVDDPDPPVIDVGVRVQVSPLVGEIESVRPTVPVNPLIGAMVIVEVSGTFVLPLTLVGLADIVKSVTVKVTIAV